MSSTDNDSFVGFEGPEKKFEVDFKPVNGLTDPNGLRSISQEKWQEMLNEAKCTIISHTPNEHFDAYVLSESSLFVYPRKVILKTCGTTTLLRTIPKLLDYARTCHLTPEWVFFARRNFIFPGKQLFPHINFDSEIQYLNNYFDGTAYVLGPLSGDHWYLYIADYVDRPAVYETDQTLEIMMTELDPTVMKQFYKDRADYVSAKDVTIKSGIADILPGSTIDEFVFDPCGYSCNGLLDDHYFTIHITPEEQCSYVSFETNVVLQNYTEIIRKVVNIFKPGNLQVVLFHDEGAVSGPSDVAFETQIDGYALKNKTFNEFEGEYNVTLFNYRKGDAVPKSLKKPKRIASFTSLVALEQEIK